MAESRTQTVIFALLGLNRAGQFLYVLLFVAAVPALYAWTTWLPRYRFTDADEQLFKAARHGDVQALQQSIAAGADVTHGSPVDRKTALFRAAVFGRVDAVRVLLEKGADPQARGSDGRSALEVVSEERAGVKDPELMRALDEVAVVLQKAAER